MQNAKCKMQKPQPHINAKCKMQKPQPHINAKCKMQKPQPHINAKCKSRTSMQNAKAAGLPLGRAALIVAR